MVMPLITCLLLYRSHTPPSAHTCSHMRTHAHTLKAPHCKCTDDAREFTHTYVRM